MLSSTQPVLPSALLDITVVCSGPRWRVLVRGEIDLRSGDDLTGVAGVLSAARAVAVDFDLGGVTFIDTAGWDAVIAARHSIVSTGGDAELVAFSPAVNRFLALVGDPAHHAHCIDRFGYR